VTDLDSSRVAMLLAVLTRHCRLAFGEQDVYAATVGGIAAAEPSVDLAIALALASAARERAIGPGVCAFGEVSLAGDVRRVRGLGQRLAEASRLGFTTALVPAAHRGEHVGTSNRAEIDTIEVATLVDALRAAARLGERTDSRRREAPHTASSGRSPLRR
jgi:DNA repair protein RadA/Sms